MGFLERTVGRLFNSPPRDPFVDKSPKLLATPSSQSSISRFSLPSSSPTSSSMSSRCSSASSSTTFWKTPKSPKWSPAAYIPSSIRNAVSKRQIAVIFCVILALLIWFIPQPHFWRHHNTHDPLDKPISNPYQVLRPTDASITAKKHAPDPMKWLQENSNNRYAETAKDRDFLRSIPVWGKHRSPKPRAALISLVRNSELDGLMQSMRQLEYHWNRKYNYPWVFFNDEEFSDEFKAATQNLTNAQCYYEVVPKEHWSLPDWIDEGRFMNSLEYLGAIGVGKGWMVSYRHMCRWNSGFFYKHPRLRDFDWYWRVEPDVHFFCSIDYDVFRFMRDNNLKYGFNMNILDDARSFPSLWSRTRSFINAHPELIHPDADLDWLLDSTDGNPTTGSSSAASGFGGAGGEYNNCQFFSNFEVGSLAFFRSPQNEKYFSWLDKGGGFYYERFGDAPIHTLSVSMFLPKREIWFFRDIGYQHDINRHCPPNSQDRCDCEPTRLDENFYKLVPLESPQRKPGDTCIRRWLSGGGGGGGNGGAGGEFVAKKEGWSADVEREWGGDGYGGYVVSGLE